VRVIGRLLTLADFESSATVRDAFVAFFDDDERIGGVDLWVLTSLLAQMDTASWFDDTLVMPAEASAAHRRRIRERIIRGWPSIKEETETILATPGIPVDPAVAGRWWSTVLRTADTPARGDDEALMLQLLAACRLNRVAGHLASQDLGEAMAGLDEIDSGLVGAADRSIRRPGGRPPAAGPNARQVIGDDGVWAAAYIDARRKTADKLASLRSLRTRPGGDLGPIDADVFAREVYRGSPKEVRSLARAIATERFGAGVNLAIELIDQFPDAPRNDGVANFISRHTGRVLPSARSEAWITEARLALVEHARSLRPGGRSVIDDVAVILTECFAERASLLRSEPAARAGLRTPQQAAALLADAWQERASALVARNPAPDDMAGLRRRRATRRRLCTSPIHFMVAEQIAILDLLTYVTVAEQPRVREAAMRILSDGGRIRAEQTHVLAQAIEAERAVSIVWALRMGLLGAEGEKVRQ